MSVEQLKFFLSTEQECSYLDGLTSASVFADPNDEMTTEMYSTLIDHGFRRSAQFVYRPHCPSCDSCKPARIPVAEFKISRNQKRVRNKNKDIVVKTHPAEFNPIHFQLYRKYISTRHADGEMNSTSEERYISFLTSDWCDTVFYEFYLEENLVAIAVTDILSNGLSALYTFFDPDYSELSLGTYAILWQIKESLRLKKKWLYLGYWIKESEKMRYKQNFSPLQIWQNERWQLLEKE